LNCEDGRYASFEVLAQGLILVAMGRDVEIGKAGSRGGRGKAIEAF
jgi:hypothetical protein